MPSVASEVHQSLSARTRQASARSQTDTDPRDPSTPFAEMLDSAGPTAEPQPALRPLRSDRPETPDRAKAAKSDAGKTADAPSSKPANQDDAKAAKDKADGAATKDAAPPDGKDAKAATDANPDKPKANADQAAALDAAVVDPTASPVTAPQVPAQVTPQAAPLAVALPTDGVVAADPAAETAPDANVIAALQVAGPQAGKPKGQQTQTAGDAKATPKSGAQDDKPAKSAAPADTQAAAPEANTAAKDGQPRPSDEDTGVPAAARRAAADLLKKIDPDAPAQRTTDASGAVKASADAMQNLGAVTQQNAGSAPAQTVNAAANVNGPAQPQAVAVPLAGLAIEIATQAHAGAKHFEIRLDPPELGRIDVKLNVDRDGNVSTKLIADRNDTLDLLKRDSTQLERALQDAGLKTSDNALQFSLRQQGFTQDDTPAQPAMQVVLPDDDPAPLEALRQGYGRLLGLGGGLDIRV